MYGVFCIIPLGSERANRLVIGSPIRGQQPTLQFSPRLPSTLNPQHLALADEADMREVSHFLLKLKNGSESRDVSDIPPTVPENEVVSGSEHADSAPPPPPASLDPLESASAETKVAINTWYVI